MSTAATTPLGTLGKRGNAFWLCQFDEKWRDAQALYALHTKRKDGPVRDALWNGYWELQSAAASAAKTIRERGGLLFIGSAAALDAARLFEREENALLLPKGRAA